MSSGGNSSLEDMQTDDEILLSVNQFAGADKIRPPAAFRVGIRGQGAPEHLALAADLGHVSIVNNHAGRMSGVLGVRAAEKASDTTILPHELRPSTPNAFSPTITASGEYCR